MIRLEEKLEKQLTQLIKEDSSFAIYQLPLSQKIDFVAQLESRPQELNRLTVLNGQKGFVISPFNTDEAHPVILIHPEIETSGLENIVHVLEFLSCNDSQEAISDTEYIEKETDQQDEYQIYEDTFCRFIAPLRGGEYKKLVLSRLHRMKKPLGFSPLKSFLRAAEAYPHMMNYLFYTPQTGLWMGCTPEIILSGKAHQWQTVALAGTMPIGESNNWDQKNVEEQEVVSKYIRQVVASYTDRIEEAGPYTSQAGNVAHLKTEFSFTLNDINAIGSLLDALHPTPAVCGFPKQEAFDFIVRNENHDRKYYSGIIGKLDPHNQTNLFVNLRCAEINQSSITLYAGSGIMPTSTPEAEWDETNYKMQTLLNII